MEIMKKLIIAIVALGAFFFTSCKKDYVCTCKKIYTDSGGNSQIYTDGSYTFKDSSPRAEERCNDLEKAGSDFGGPYTRECAIQ